MIALSIFAAASMTDSFDSDRFWGTDPAQRFTHAHDFFYALWLAQPDEWFNDAWLDREQAALEHQKRQWPPNLSASERTKKMKKFEKDLANLTKQRKQFAVRRQFRLQWPQRLERMSAFACQWCGRDTTLAVREVAKGQIQPAWAAIQGSSFNDWHGLRTPRTAQPDRLCPACTAARFNHQGHRVPSFASALNIYIDPIQRHPCLVTLSRTPWWERPWHITPALWTTLTHSKIPTDWSKRHWLWQALPTLSSQAVNFWYAGENVTLPIDLLQDLQRTMREQVQAGRYIADSAQRNHAQHEYNQWLRDWCGRLPRRLHLAADHAFVTALTFQHAVPSAVKLYPDKSPEITDLIV